MKHRNYTVRGIKACTWINLRLFGGGRVIYHLSIWKNQLLSLWQSQHFQDGGLRLPHGRSHPVKGNFIWSNVWIKSNHCFNWMWCTYALVQYLLFLANAYNIHCISGLQVFFCIIHIRYLITVWLIKIVELPWIP